MADAAPPPLQIPAAPNSPDFKACTRETTIREPELPMGCPRATAPLGNNYDQQQGRVMIESESTCPSMLILSYETPKACSAIRTTTEKASLISKRAISLISRPALFKAIGIARAGASGKSMGLTPTSEKAMGVVSQGDHIM